MPNNFPDSPAEIDSFTSGGKKWIFNGTVWTLVTANAYTIPTGEVTTAKILDANVTAAKLASGAAVANIGYTPANIASPTFTGTVVLPSTTSIGTVSSTELGYVDGVTSAIQTQLDSKLTATTAATSNRNVLINGGMQISQRGISTTATGNTFLIDRWIHACSGSNTTIRDTASVPTGFKYAWKWTSGGSGVYNLIAQQIEYQNFIQMVGQTVTLSFYAKANTANAGSTAFIAATRTSTSEDTAVYFSGTYTPASFTLTTSWARYSTQFTIGATVKSLAIEFQSGTASATVSTDGVAITGVQLEVGAVATPFEFEDIGATLAKCQRYFEKSYDIGTTPGTASTLGESIGLGIYTNTPAAYNRFGSGVSFKVPKRATPTVVQYAPTSGSSAAASNATSGDGVTAVGYVLASQVNQNGFNLAASVGGSTSTGYFTIFIAYTASAEL